MIENRKTLRGFVVLVAVASVSACAKPPADAINAAEQARTAAVTADAAEYAPDAMNNVNQAKAALDAELAAQSGRMALRRSYKHADELAIAYKKAADDATQQANAAKEAAKQETTQLVSDTRVELDSVSAMLAKAPVGKGSRADLAALKADLQTAGTSLTQAQSSIDAGKYLDAKTQASTARETVDKVKAAVEQARAMVHPRRGRRI